MIKIVIFISILKEGIEDRYSYEAVSKKEEPLKA